MSSQDNVAQAYRAPLSGTIVGVLVREFQLNSPGLNTKTAKRYFRGQRVKDASRFEVIEAVADVLVKEGFVPRLPFLDNQGWPVDKLLTLVMVGYAKQWDGLAGLMRSASAPVDRPDLAATAYLRLATIDLALRLSALLWLANASSPEQGVPIWAEPKGGAQYLKGLLEKCGSSALTRDKLADQVGVSYNTVDSWLDAGVRPSLTNLQGIAAQLAPHIEGAEPSTLLVQLRLNYSLSSICDILARHVGRETVLNLASALMRFTGRNVQGLREFSKLPPDEGAMAQIAIFICGARFPSCEHLTKALWRREKDPVWRADLEASSKPWDLRLVHLMKGFGGTDQMLQKLQTEYGIAEGIATDLLEEAFRHIPADPTIPEWVPHDVLEDMQFVRIKGDAAYSARNRMTQYEWARAKGDLETAIHHVRRAVELQPENALYHFELGATLGTAGEVSEGIQECWISDGLDPSWELPKVEVGIILLNAGRSSEALVHLEQMAEGQEDPSAHLAFNLGVARSRCGEYGRALEALLRVVELQADHALALDFAAHSAFMAGDGKTGRRLAKKANDLGRSETYVAWRKGKYRGGRV